MSDEIRDVLREILATEGLAICHDPVRCEALLRNRCGNDPKIIWLIGALREDVVPELLGVLAGETVESRIARLSERIAKSLRLEQEAARLAVETWAHATGILRRHEEATEGPTIAPADGQARSLADMDLSDLECDRCGESIEFSGDKLRCIRCKWVYVLDEEGELVDHPGMIYWSCSKCDEEHQVEFTGAYKCLGEGKGSRPMPFDGSERCLTLPWHFEDRFCWIWHVDEIGNLSKPPQIIEWYCPKCESHNQTGEAGEVLCVGDNCNFPGGKVDANGDFSPPLIEWECPNCIESCFVQAPGSVICDNTDCNWEVVIDQDGEVVDGVIEVDCPGCYSKLYFQEAGAVRCYSCFHEFTFEDDGEITDGAVPIKCLKCHHRTYRGFAFGQHWEWKCPKCGSSDGQEFPAEEDTKS